MIRKIFKTLSVLTREERMRMLALTFGMVAAALLESLSVSAIVPLVASIAADGGTIDLPFFRQISFKGLIMLLIALFIIKNVFLFYQQHLELKCTSAIRKRVQNSLLRYYLQRDYSFFLNSDSGDIMHTITVDSDYYYATLNHIVTIFTRTILLIVMSIAVLLIDARMSLLMGGVLLLEYAFISLIIRPLLRRWGKEYRQALTAGNDTIIELLRGIKTIKSASAEELFRKRYGRQVDELISARLKESTFNGFNGRFMEAVSVSAILLYILTFRKGEDMAALIPTFSAFAMATIKIMPCVSAISGAIGYVNYYEGSLDRVCAIMEKLNESKTGSKGDPYPFNDRIELKDICFAYPQREQIVLSKLSLTIRKNEMIAISGTSGEGKTTLVDIILGLLKPDEGEVLLDGEKADTSTGSWHDLFAYIPQDVFILKGTIGDNIRFASRCEDEQLMKQAAAVAQLDELLESLPDGLDTQTGEAGVQLSGGQVQRIGIARAIYSGAPVIVFDEATSALDEATERKFLEQLALLKGQKTVIFISHRKAAMDYCDAVYELSNGRLNRTN